MVLCHGLSLLTTAAFIPTIGTLVIAVTAGMLGNTQATGTTQLVMATDWRKSVKKIITATSHERHGVSKITRNSIVCSAACSNIRQRISKASYYWPFARGIQQWAVNFTHKRPSNHSHVKVSPWHSVKPFQPEVEITHVRSDGYPRVLHTYSFPLEKCDSMPHFVLHQLIFLCFALIIKTVLGLLPTR